MKKFYLIIFIMVAASYIINIIVLPFVPAKIATHWNIKGQPDGYMLKVPGLLFLSVLITLIAVITLIIAQLEEMKDKLKNYAAYYYFFCAWVIMFLLCINIHIVLWNTQVLKIHPQHVFYPAITVLFAGMVYIAFKKNNK